MARHTARLASIGHVRGRRCQLRCAFTLVELLVVIAIIGVLVALLLPAVQAARESSRRTECLNNLRQQGVALQLYHNSHDRFPPGRSNPSTDGVSWAFELLPYLEYGQVYNALDRTKRVDDVANSVAMRTPVPTFFCPTRRGPVADRDFDNDDAPSLAPGVGAAGDYAANAGHELWVFFNGEVEPYGDLDPAKIGPMFTFSKVAARHVTDGVSQTLAVGERYISPLYLSNDNTSDHYARGDTAFFSGDYAPTVLRDSAQGIVQASTIAEGTWIAEPFGSEHSELCQFVFLDGHARSFTCGLDVAVLKRLCAIGDNEPVGELPD